MTKPEKVEQLPPSVLDEKVEHLRQMFPELFSEGKLDVPKLRQILGETVDEGTERYNFTWAGKRAAIQALQLPSRATLVPCHEGSVNFHSTDNIFIEGDNLEVLKILSKPYFGEIKTIYIDPPYNTGNDFLYKDNYADPLDSYLQITKQKDSEGNILTSNPETSGHFHSNWLSMMYPRLYLARQLLSDDGIIFVSIDDNEVNNLRHLMNEIFGEENCIQQLVWQRHGGAGNQAKYCATDHEYILVYAKHLQSIDNLRRPLTEEEQKQYTKKDEHYSDLGPYKTRPFESQEQYGGYKGHKYEIVCPDNTKIRNEWRWGEKRFIQAQKDNKVVFTEDENGNWKVAYKLYQKESGRVLRSLLTEVERNSQGRTQIKELFNEYHIFDYPKPVGLIKHLIQFSTNTDSIVLDFFAGSCTTAQAVLELNKEDGGNRKFIMVQLPEPTPEKSAARKSGYETISEIGKERIKRVIAKMNKENNLFETEEHGIKVFKLTESNYRSWIGVEKDDAESYAEQMNLLLENPLVDGWVPEHLIYEVALKEGYRLDSHIQKIKDVEYNSIYQIVSADQNKTFYICLDDELYKEDIDKLRLSSSDLFICRDRAMNDTEAANLALQCRLKTI